MKNYYCSETIFVFEIHREWLSIFCVIFAVFEEAQNNQRFKQKYNLNISTICNQQNLLKPPDSDQKFQWNHQIIYFSSLDHFTNGKLYIFELINDLQSVEGSKKKLSP